MDHGVLNVPLSKRDKIEMLHALVGDKMASNLFVSKSARGEFLAADTYLRTYFFILGNFDLAAYERTMRSVKRRGFSTKTVYVIATGFETYQDRERVRFHKASDLKPRPSPSVITQESARDA